MSERPKENASKAFVGASPPRVQIPPPPPVEALTARKPVGASPSPGPHVPVRQPPPTGPTREAMGSDGPSTPPQGRRQRSCGRPGRRRPDLAARPSAAKAAETAGAARAAEAAQAANAASEASTVLLRTPLQLQKKFKHAGDFGVDGGHSKANAAKFSAAIHRHINAAGTQRIVGTCRNAPAAHYLDPKTGLNVVSDLDGNFITGFRLGSGQLDDVLTNGRLW